MINLDNKYKIYEGANCGEIWIDRYDVKKWHKLESKYEIAWYYHTLELQDKIKELEWELRDLRSRMEY